MEEDCSICPVSITLFFLCSLIFGMCILQVNCKSIPKLFVKLLFFSQGIKKKKHKKLHFEMSVCLHSLCESTSESVLGELNSTSIKERKLFAIRNFYFNIRTPRMKSFN